MKKITFLSLCALFLLAACGEKAAAPAANNGAATAADKPAEPAKPNAADAPIFSAEESSPDELMAAMQATEYTKGFSLTGKGAVILLDGELMSTYLGGTAAAKISQKIDIMQDKDKPEEGMVREYLMVAASDFDGKYGLQTTIIDGKLIQCTCYEPKGEPFQGGMPIFARMSDETVSNSFLYEVEKKVWRVLKNKERIPSIEMQQKMYADCQTLTKAALDFKQNKKDDPRWKGAKVK